MATGTIARAVPAHAGGLSALTFPKVVHLCTGTDQAAGELTPQRQTTTKKVWKLEYKCSSILVWGAFHRVPQRNWAPIVHGQNLLVRSSFLDFSLNSISFSPLLFSRVTFPINYVHSNLCLRVYFGRTYIYIYLIEYILNIYIFNWSISERGWET